ncbi:MAG: hypothetical protein M0Z42_13070 [Actinomycetota bacterium]|nr:hypothetical protein [Actinomycetota bacterium]
MVGVASHADRDDLRADLLKPLDCPVNGKRELMKMARPPGAGNGHRARRDEGANRYHKCCTEVPEGPRGNIVAPGYLGERYKAWDLCGSRLIVEGCFGRVGEAGIPAGEVGAEAVVIVPPGVSSLTGVFLALPDPASIQTGIITV